MKKDILPGHWKPESMGSIGSIGIEGKVSFLSMVVLVLVLFLGVIPIPAASAQDITLSVDQTEYYFLVGEEPVVPLHIENTYDRQIDGILGYTATQQITQQNFQYSSSNTQSTSFSMANGKSTVNLGFATSDKPMSMIVGLTFTYDDKDMKETRVVTLQDITLNFVADESQKKNEQNKMESSSQSASQQQQQQSQQDPFAQQQQMINQMLNQQQIQQQTQSQQQRLQNSQLSQDSSALKQQIQKQLQEQQQLKEEFQNQIAQNDEFQTEHQKLLNQGFNVTDGSIDPTSNNSGTFEVNYENSKGEKASLAGEMQNGEMTQFNKQTPEERQRLFDSLNQSKEFLKYKEQLEKEGFSQQNMEISHDGNRTDVRLNYTNGENQTASIKAEIINGTVEKVELEKEGFSESYMRMLLLLFLLSSLVVVSAILYNNYVKKPVQAEDMAALVMEEPFDYAASARRMLDEAKQLFETQNYKDAYGRAGQALRLFLSYENGLKRELTNDEVVSYLKGQGKGHSNIQSNDYREIKECFDLCSLVEFAKYKANREDFENIMAKARGMIDG